MRKKIMVAIPSRNLVGHDLCGPLATWLYRQNRDKRYHVELGVGCGFGVDVVRNRIVAGFLVSDAEFLLMIDDDMVPPENLLEMSEHDCDIVGSLYYAWEKGSGPFVAAYYQKESGQYWRPGLGEVEHSGLHEVALVGSGCLLIHRRVLQELPQPWFQFEISDDGQKVLTPEDFLFCQRATQHGFKVFLDTDRICGHIKRVDLRDVASMLIQRKQTALFDLLE